jgi:alkanesulfonate monooxygenase SsuD/methylene tetrahydromethanopterin reductase-like flavin-dependent oxidoreductase (luciferase family)
VLWYYRTIANYVATHGAQAPVKGYEAYSNVRHAALTAKWDELLRARTVICGSPDFCAEQIEGLRHEYGFTQLLCWTRLAGLDNRKVLKSMELMQKSVIPHFKKEAPRARVASMG